MNLKRFILLFLFFVILLQTAGITENWPQLGHDPYRSNSTPDNPVPPFSLKWTWLPPHGDYLAGHVQPVIANNIIVAGSLDGYIYGISAGPSGNGSTLWEYKTGGPISHTSVIANVGGTWRCYTGCNDFKLYCLALSNGGFQWSYTAKGNIMVAPLFAENRIFIGDSAGYLSCIDAQTGNLVWEKNLGAPIQCCPTYGDGGKIFTATEDMFAQCLSSTDGTILWKTKLYGSGFMLYWPVFSSVENSVVYRTRKVTPNGSDVLEPDILDILKQYPDSDNNDNYYTTCQEAIRTYYTNNPTLRTFHILNADTGALRFVAPVANLGRHQDCPNPPVLDRNGRFMVCIRTRRSDWYGFSYASGQDENGQWGTIVPSFARLNTTTGLFERIAPYHSFNTWLGRMCCDDMSQFTIAGNYIVMNHRAFSVINMTTYAQTSIRGNDYTGITWSQGNGNTENASYGYNPVVVSDGILYVHDASVESGATGSIAAIE